MLLLGIDIGTSSVKVSVVDAATQQTVAFAQCPKEEAHILTPQPGWAEQSPDSWWQQFQHALILCHESKKYNPQDIGAIGIAYQMHGLVLVDKNQKSLRNSIIWCDSRSVAIGDQAFINIGGNHCFQHLLNSPGNFTASKLAWVKENEPEIYDSINKVMLPGDYIAMQLTGEVTTSISGLSEGIFYDFNQDQISSDILDYFKFDKEFFAEIKPVFGTHGHLKSAIAAQLNLRAGIPVSYKAGDQPNNALSLNVLQPGEVAATAGTSGVIYPVSDELVYDHQSRINTFAHVNYTPEQKRLGSLLCINGTGSLNRWAKNALGQGLTYTQINKMAASIPPGSHGLQVLPFGNGAERMLGNKELGAQWHGMDVNLHTRSHIFRAIQEGIAFTFRYGLDIMRENGIAPKVIRAGHSNLFLSEIFTETFVNATGVPVELYQNDGSVGAALGAGIGAGIYKSTGEAFEHLQLLKTIEPFQYPVLEDHYQAWAAILQNQLQQEHYERIL